MQCEGLLNLMIIIIMIILRIGSLLESMLMKLNVILFFKLIILEQIEINLNVQSNISDFYHIKIQNKIKCQVF